MIINEECEGLHATTGWVEHANIELNIALEIIKKHASPEEQAYNKQYWSTVKMVMPMDIAKTISYLRTDWRKVQTELSDLMLSFDKGVPFPEQ